MLRVAMVLGLTLAFGTTASAKAYYAGKEEMVQKAEAIVVVTVTKVEAVRTKGKNWTYAQKATATVEQCLKGGLAGTIEIGGQENFICARCEYKPGRFILFLRKDGALWAGSNWDLGIRPIEGDQAEWFKPGGQLFETSDQPLDAVLDEIRKALAGGKP